jgi:hypothetical protein
MASTTVAGQAAVAAVRVQLDRQHLVQLNDGRFEAQSRPGHVQAPHRGGPQADLLDRLVLVLDEIAAPVAQRQYVVVWRKFSSWITSRPMSGASVMMRPEPVSSPSGNT